TEPDFVSRAIEFNVHTTTLSSQPIPEEVIPVSVEDSKKGTTRKDARDGWEERIPAWIKNLYRRENRRFEFPDRLKLTNPSDITLLKYYFAQRVFRIAIYKDNWWLSQPEADVAAHIPGLNLLRLRLESRNRRQEKELRDIEEQTQKFLEDNYATEPERHHARTIELAVNDLVAKATSNDDLAKVVLTKPLVDAWGDSWVKRLWSI
ncbi:MAG: hypothetical protein HYS68_01675, partial [Candidatus Levybacteria bacterium]|nr:hypothetical protein [Candidatus Levybacteria bacterium]